MSLTPHDENGRVGVDGEEDPTDGEWPMVPEGVLRGIEDVAEGNTASKDDIASVLKF